MCVAQLLAQALRADHILWNLFHLQSGSEIPEADREAPLAAAAPLTPAENLYEPLFQWSEVAVQRDPARAAGAGQVRPALLMLMWVCLY